MVEREQLRRLRLDQVAGQSQPLAYLRGFVFQNLESDREAVSLAACFRRNGSPALHALDQGCFLHESAKSRGQVQLSCVRLRTQQAQRREGMSGSAAEAQHTFIVQLVKSTTAGRAVQSGGHTASFQLPPVLDSEQAFGDVIFDADQSVDLRRLRARRIVVRKFEE